MPVFEKQNIYDNTMETFTSIKNKLNFLKDTIPKKSCFLGWDGFIDYLYSIIQSRESINKWTRMESMKTFGKLVLEVTGSSAGMESVLKRKISGGFSSNTCKGMNGLGVKMFLVSAWGYPTIDDVFTPLVTRDSIDAISFTNPGTTIGLEFNDGKIMITDFENILKINWQLLNERVGLEVIAKKIELADILGFGYWAPILHFDDIMIHLLDDIFPSINNLKNKLCFMDLADTKKRSKSDIKKMLKILQKVDYQIPLLLSLNDQESIDVLGALNSVKTIDASKKNFQDHVVGGKKINNEINLSYLVVHCPHFATISTKDEHYWVSQCFTSNPKFIVSAGDHFNAGTAVGLACKLSPPESILMGNALTSVFIRTGNSPTFEVLSQFIRRYMEFIEISNRC